MSDKNNSKNDGRVNKKNDMWDIRSKSNSDKNYTLAGSMGNPMNNTDNPNWRNQMMETGYRQSMLNDPQRVEEKHRVEDNNGNKEVMKDYPVNPS